MNKPLQNGIYRVRYISVRDRWENEDGDYVEGQILGNGGISVDLEGRVVIVRYEEREKVSNDNQR